MDSAQFSEARLFLYRSARLLERREFEFYFESGPRLGVISALKAYQNPDGGFGNALEPDKRVPASQPLDVQFALEVLDRCDLLGNPLVYSGTSLLSDILLPACDYLSAVSAPDGGVTCVTAAVNAFPRTPWWNVDESKDPAGDLNPTAAIAGLMLKAGVQHPWLDGAVDFCRRKIEAGPDLHFNTMVCVLTFLANDPERAWAEGQLESIEQDLRKPGVIEMDPSKGGYVQFPTDWAPTPRHFARRLFDSSTIDLHLRALQDRQQPDGGWPITWEAISPAVEMEWRGVRTLDALITLKEYEGE
jgi:hypothetical protein